MHDGISNLGNPSRRRFLAGAGLIIGVSFVAPNAFAATLLKGSPADVQAAAGAVMQRLRPHRARTIRSRVLSKHIEFGQGPYTGLATLVAEELDADWSQMRAAAAPADDKIYANLIFGVQGTGGSSAIANSFEQMRKAGATARAMLVAAAAQRMEGSRRRDHRRDGPGEAPCERPGKRLRGTGRAAADHAAASRSEAQGAGGIHADRQKQCRGSTRSQNRRGEAIYTIDVEAADMLVAVVAPSPIISAAMVKSFDDSASAENSRRGR